jgi:hypothetical protein
MKIMANGTIQPMEKGRHDEGGNPKDYKGEVAFFANRLRRKTRFTFHAKEMDDRFSIVVAQTRGNRTVFYQLFSKRADRTPQEKELEQLFEGVAFQIYAAALTIDQSYRYACQPFGGTFFIRESMMAEIRWMF